MVVSPALMRASLGMASFRIGHDFPMISSSIETPAECPNGDRRIYLRNGNPPSRAWRRSGDRFPGSSRHRALASAAIARVARESRLPTRYRVLRRTPDPYRPVRSESPRSRQSSPSGSRTGRSSREESWTRAPNSGRNCHRPLPRFSRGLESCGSLIGQATPQPPQRATPRSAANRYQQGRWRRERIGYRRGPFDAQALGLQ